MAEANHPVMEALDNSQLQILRLAHGFVVTDTVRKQVFAFEDPEKVLAAVRIFLGLDAPWGEAKR